MCVLPSVTDTLSFVCMERFKSSENIPASLPPRQHMSCESDVGFRSWTYGGDAVVPSMLDGHLDDGVDALHPPNAHGVLLPI